MVLQLVGLVRQLWKNITLEPVVILYTLILALSSIPGEELYLMKACKVNLNLSDAVCDDIYSHKDEQVATQQIVSGLQAHSAVLQSIPGILFILFAGPLSDTYGRKFLMIISLFGYLILNTVFLVNSIWFHQLKAEFLLFECLQDISGGQVVFFIAVRCYMMDITKESSRTSRLAVLDGFYGVGYLIGLPLGTHLKKYFGYVALFSTTIAITFLTILYIIIFITDSFKLVSEDKRKELQEERNKNRIQFNKDFCKKMLELITSSVRTLLRKREGRTRTWLLLFTASFACTNVVTHGYGIVGFMFYRLQYNLSTIMYGHLISTWFVCNFFAQLFVVPFLSEKLKLRDTTLIIVGYLPAIPGFFGEAFFSEAWVLFVIWSVFYPLYFCTVTAMRSSMSKMIGPGEIGKVFAALGVLG